MKHFRFILTVLLALILGAPTAVAQKPTLDPSSWTALYYKSNQRQAPPADNWYALDFDDTSWDEITGPITTAFQYYDAYWCRQWIDLTEEQIAQGDFYMRVAHDDEGKVYVNGQIVMDCGGACSDHSFWISNSYFVPGPNLIAAYCYDNGGGEQYLDFRLYTANDHNTPLEGYALLHVTEPELRVSQKSLTLYDVDQANYRTATLTTRLYTPEGLCDAPIIWESSNTEVATVVDGVVSVVAAGKTTITASAVVGETTVTTTIEVEVVGFPADKKVVFLDEAGTLGNYLTQDEIEDLTNLTIFGPINGTDVRILRAMAGRDINGNATGYSLQELDLTNARFVNGGEPYCDGNTSGLDYINYYMFQNCTMLREIWLPKRLTRIQGRAFAGCSRLHTVHFAEDCGLTYIEWGAFEYCGLTRFDFPRSITSLGGWVFQNNNKLVEVNFPEDIQLEQLSSELFQGCSNLSSITIPASLKVINNNAFRDSGLRSVTFAEGSKLESIGSYAFSWCQSLTSIVIPESCTALGEGSFDNCRSLQKITLPSRLRALSPALFKHCDALTSFTVPTGIRVVGNEVFYDCDNLATIIFPEGTEVRELGERAISESYNLKHIFMMAAEPPVIEDNTFEGLRDFSVYVPEAALNKYNNDSKWGRLNIQVFDDQPTLSFAESNVTLVGGTQDATLAERQLNLMFVNPLGVETTLVWSTSDPEVATVTQDGLVKIVSAGHATITATLTYKDKDYTAECEVECVMFDADKTIVYVKQPGTLYSQLTDEQRQNLTEINVAGVLNDDDINTMRNNMPNLERIVLINVANYFTEAGCVYRTSDNYLLTVPRAYQGVYTTPDFMTFLPTNAFNNGVSGITQMVLGKNLTRIESWAFQNFDDSKLQSIVVLNPEPVSADYWDSFEYLNTGAYPVIVPHGCLEAYRNSSWNRFSMLMEGVTETTFRINQSEVALYQTTDEATSKTQLTVFAMTPTAVVTPTVQWRSKNEDVAVVTEDGEVLMTGVGTATIVATTTIEGTEYTSECQVKCYAPSGDEMYVYVKEPGTLRELIPNSQMASITDLALFGTINADDIQTIRIMAGRDEEENEIDGSLRHLNLSQVKVVNGGSYRTLWGWNEGTDEDSFNSGVFAECNTLETVVLPNGVRRVGDYTFHDCHNLKSVTLPNSLSYLSHRMFYNCYALETFEIPASIESMNSEVFNECQNLKRVTFATGSRLTEISNHVFYNCRSLEDIVLPASIRSINEYAFAECYALKSINIPAAVTTISQYAFQSSGLAEVDIPEDSQLTTIGTNAFNNTRVRSFYVPEGLRSITAARINNDNLESVTAHADNANYFAEDGVLYSKRDNSIALMPHGKTGVFRTPDFLTTISAGAFNGCTKLNSIVLGAGVTNIAENAFGNCNAMNAIFTLRPEVITATATAFDGLDKEHVSIFVPVGSLAAYKSSTWGAFENIYEFSAEPQLWIAQSAITLYDTKIESTRSRQLEAMLISAEGPQTVSVEWSVADEDVAEVSADGIVTLLRAGKTRVVATATYEGQTYTAECEVTIYGTEDGIDLLYVERPGTVNDMLSAEDRQRITDLIVIGNVNSNDLSVIGDMARSYNGNLRYLDLSQVNVQDKRIADSSFQDNTQLVEVSLPEGIEYIGYYAFYNTALKEVVVPESVKEMRYCAFGNCSNLGSVTVSDNVQYENEVFGWSPSENLQTLNIRVKDIEHDLNYLLDRFDDNRTNINYLVDGQPMTEVNFPEGIRRIGARRFYGCRTLESLTIPASVVEIGDRAFEGIAEVHFLGTVPAALASIEGFSDMGTYIVPAEALTTYRTADVWKEFSLSIIPDNAQLAFDLTVTADRDKSAVVAAAGGEAQVEFATRLTLHGSINSYDIFAFRTKMPNLHYLDLTDVEIVGNPYEYYTGCYTEDHRLGRRSFFEMPKLVEVRLPKHITEIGDEAFVRCYNLRRVEMHEGIETIGGSAFFECRSISHFDLPDGIRTINGNAFYGCNSVEELTFGDGLLRLGGGQELRGLKTVRFPDCTEYIDGGAFQHCNNLKNVYLPKALTSIDNYTFYNCNSLENIVLPTGIYSIGWEAFAHCSNLKELRLPPMLEYIGDNAFAGCDNLADVYTYVVVPKDIPIGQTTFSKNCYDHAMLHVPDFSRYAYMWNTQWGQFHDMTEFTDTYDTFYAKNTLTLDNTTGGIDGTPDATIHPTGGIEVGGDVSQDLGEVDINHDGTDGGSIIPENDGNIKIKHLNVKINIEADRWYFFCFPFNVPLDDVKYGGEYVWRQYDGAKRSRREGGWQDLPEGTTELIAGRGYIFQGTNSSVLHLNIHNPEIVSGDVSSDLETYVGIDTSPADASWNFIGNPYTSYYTVDESTYSAPITVWTGSRYEAYRPGDDDYEFAPYQAFFVQTPSSGNKKVDFAADNRESYEQAQETQSNRRMARARRKVNPNRLLINLELLLAGTETCVDKTRIVFNDDTSLDYEPECDAAKFFSEENQAELYTLDANGTEYAINERPEDDGVISIGFIANQKGKYAIAAQRMDVPMILVDHVRETTHDLSLGAYEFSAAKGTYNKRFALKPLEGIATTIDQLADKIGAGYSISGGTIALDGISDDVRVAVYNMAGQQMGAFEGSGSVNVQPGAYVITVGKLAAKVIVK